jgi:hypothetical protein
MSKEEQIEALALHYFRGHEELAARCFLELLRIHGATLESVSPDGFVIDVDDTAALTNLLSRLGLPSSLLIGRTE